MSIKLLIEPSQIQIQYGLHGKPFLPNTLWRFNISHSQQMLMIGFIKGMEIGVDIEYINHQNNISILLNSVLTKDELIVYRQKRKKEKIAYFYAIWSKKEAYSKAIGKGLNVDFNTLNLEQTKYSHLNSGIKNSFSWTYCIL